MRHASISKKEFAKDMICYTQLEHEESVFFGREERGDMNGNL